MASGDFHDEGERAQLLRKKTELLASFKRGAQLAHELLEENELLRQRLVSLESQTGTSSPEPTGSTAVSLIAELEQENNALASLFVAQSQLHGATSITDVLTVMTEVLLNFVGASTFSILLLDNDKRVRPISSHGIVLDAVPSSEVGVGPIGETVKSAHMHLEMFRDADPVNDAPVACFPIRSGPSILGAVAIWKFLPQKNAILDVDTRLFDLIGSAGGLGLDRARSEMPNDDNKQSPYQAVSSLLE